MMSDAEYDAMLADALERLADMALPENAGSQLTPEDQRACYAVVMHHRMIAAKAKLSEATYADTTD